MCWFWDRRVSSGFPDTQDFAVDHVSGDDISQVVFPLLGKVFFLSQIINVVLSFSFSSRSCSWISFFFVFLLIFYSLTIELLGM